MIQLDKQIFNNGTLVIPISLLLILVTISGLTMCGRKFLFHDALWYGQRLVKLPRKSFYK